MTWINRFFQYTEIKTKITSIFTFVLCIAFFLMNSQPLRWLPTLVFLLGMLLFDLTTTSINNYIDSKTDGTVLPFVRRRALVITVALLLLSAGSGIWLVLLSDPFVLILGACCFICGIFYTFGPVPISRLPLGEFLSGLFYGFFIPWIFLYINYPPELFMAWTWGYPSMLLSLYLPNLIGLALLSAAPFCCTANVMLANNLCDLDKDLQQGRRTLPSFIGLNRGLYLFAALAALPYLALIFMVLSGLARPVVLLALLTAWPVLTNTRKFFVRQDKRETFPLSLSNFILTMGSFCLAMLLGRWI